MTRESVWDYPRPPRLEPTPHHIRIVHAGLVIADTVAALRILETSHPPVYYVPPADVARLLLSPSARSGSFCEWKGIAQYWTLDVGKQGPQNSEAQIQPQPEARVVDAAWSYRSPTGRYAALRDYFAFYPGKIDECTVDGERVLAQPGDFYGGWITSNLVGPFKGAPGTLGW